MKTNALPILLRLLHWFIILNLLIQIAYAGYIVFFEIVPTGSSGPLMGAAKNFPFEQMVTRRLYAIECWIAIVGLSLYLGLTEILPRLLHPLNTRSA